VTDEGRDGAIAELTRYRRWLRQQANRADALPVVYNDFMNTLMGDPTWDRSSEARDVVLPGAPGTSAPQIVQLIDTDQEWTVRRSDADLIVTTIAGISARIIELS
jgi:hypothetical protein